MKRLPLVKAARIFLVLFGVRRLDAALVLGGLTPSCRVKIQQAWSRQAATDQSGVEPPHSK